MFQVYALNHQFGGTYMHELKELNELVLHNGGMVSYLENNNALNEEPSYPITSSQQNFLPYFP